MYFFYPQNHLLSCYNQESPLKVMMWELIGYLGGAVKVNKVKCNPTMNAPWSKDWLQIVPLSQTQNQCSLEEKQECSH